MTNAKLHSVLIAVLGLVLFTSCSKDETDAEITTADTATISSNMAKGQWRITYYFDSDKDETPDYNGYVFTFDANGPLGVTDGSTSLSGAWSVTSSDKSDDDSKDVSDIDFNILFNGSALFEELSDDWDIVKYSDAKIELFDISGGDGTTDYLTFEKI